MTKKVEHTYKEPWWKHYTSPEAADLARRSGPRASRQAAPKAKAEADPADQAAKDMARGIPKEVKDLKKDINGLVEESFDEYGFWGME